jgi:hypothetical protein
MAAAIEILDKTSEALKDAHIETEEMYISSEDDAPGAPFILLHYIT